MMVNPSRQKPIAFQAQDDFTRARRKAFMEDMASFLMGQPNELLSFEQVRQQFPIKSQVYRGVETIPISKIAGSVDRYEDFNRNFLPTQTHTQPRWENVDRAALAHISLPPIQVYKLGDIYFVKDGNHRVSVAREKGQAFVDAQVIEMKIRVPLSPGMDMHEMLRLAEHARFLDQTNLDNLRPGACIEFSTLGRYDVLVEHISAHRWYMGIDQKREVSWEEAVLDWYDNVYTPMVKIIMSQRVLSQFPGRTPADMYLWIMDHRYYLSKETGRQVGAETAVLSYNRSQVRWARRVLGWANRLLNDLTRPFAVTGQAIARALKTCSLQR